MTYILGISAFYHDSAAALIKNGEIVSAVQEERLTRIKHDHRFPINAIDNILKQNNLSINQIDHICFYDKPFLKFERLLETYLSHVPIGFSSFRKSMPIWLKEKLFQKNLITTEFKKVYPSFNNQIHFSEHHLSHAASAFYTSKFRESLVLTVDGVGEWATTTISFGNENDLKMLKEIHYPHSIGLLYSSFTYYLGFKINDGEYKVMGLAPYGKPIFKDIIFKKLIILKKDGSFKLNQDFFQYSTGLKMINKRFESLFGIQTRKSNEKLKQIHMDIAASVQAVIEDVLIGIIDHMKGLHPTNNLCMAGGVALNCVANSKILKSKKFKNIWVQPAAGDAGGAIGAALALWHIHQNNKKIEFDKEKMNGSYLGPSFNSSEIERDLSNCGAVFTKMNEGDLIKHTAKLLSEGKIFGWFQGRMEFGPRALGNRSILADPRNPEMQKILNLKIKFRESFRPFAPSILSEDIEEWFEEPISNSYMLFVSDVSKNKRKQIPEKSKNLKGFELLDIDRSMIPSVTHIDFSARVQAVNYNLNKKYYNLINEFKKITNCPILINTSFNLKDEPIVCKPYDAYKCFMASDIDYLVIENYILSKQDQNII